VRQVVTRCIKQDVARMIKQAAARSMKQAVERRMKKQAVVEKVEKEEAWSKQRSVAGGM